MLEQAKAAAARLRKGRRDDYVSAYKALRSLVLWTKGRRPEGAVEEEWSLAFKIARAAVLDDLPFLIAGPEATRRQYSGVMADVIVAAFTTLLAPLTPSDSNLSEVVQHTLAIRLYHVELSLLRQDKLTIPRLEAVVASIEQIERTSGWLKGRDAG